MTITKDGHPGQEAPSAGILHMLQRPKLDRGIVRPIERTRIDGHEAASPVGEQPYERLGYVSTHGLPNENRPFESLAREDLLEHQRKVVQAPIERERPRLPMEGESHTKHLARWAK